MSPTLEGLRVREDLYPLAAACGVPNYASMPGDALRAALAAHPALPAALARRNARPAPVAAAPTVALADALAAAVAAAVASTPAALDEGAVRSIVADAVAAAADGIVSRAREGMVRTIVLRAGPDAPPRAVGAQHRAFPRLARIVGARRPDGHRLIPALVGPPGTGKSRAARAIAEGLGLRYGESPPITDRSDLLGYRDVSGSVVRTPFRECWEHGGVFLLDEFDGSDPSAMISINGGLDSGLMAFPDAVVARHPDCIVILGGNTFGRGDGGARYSGRVRQDDSLASRIYWIRWGLDEALEDAISTDARWLLAVRAGRKAAADRGLPHHVTMRAVVIGQAALAAGEHVDEVIESVLVGGLQDDAARAVMGAAQIAYGEV